MFQISGGKLRQQLVVMFLICCERRGYDFECCKTRRLQRRNPTTYTMSLRVPLRFLRKSLLYAIGAPIQPGDNMNTTHDAVITAVQTLYDTYKGRYGWEKRILQID